MKRAISMMAAAALATVLAGCSPAPAGNTDETPRAPGDWARPPLIERVSRQGDELLVSGVAEPGGRVVLRSETGSAYAASADANGRFEIHVAAKAGHLLLRPETQVGQDAAPSPDRLLILAGGDGPMALLRFGGPARRLDAAPALGAVDSDGRMRLASGVTAEGTAQVDVISDGQTLRVTPGSDGRWSLMLPMTSAPDGIEVAGRIFAWPGEAPGGESLSVEQGAAGWRVGWSGAGGGRQSTWLPVGEGR